ncbi:MAG: hypothetical protein Fur0041_03800 [Bacteroidia bacterium]
MSLNKTIENLKYDFPASIVVFLVAMPLCLGIALASGAPPFAGIIAGIIGGILVGFISNSAVSVSGPAAGLTVIVLSGIQQLNNSFEAFLVVTVLAGIIQVLFGVFKLGIIVYWFPSSVIRGMLAAIGIILIMKQIPHAVGYDADFEGDESFIQPDHENTFTEILHAFSLTSPGAILISALSVLILIVFDLKAVKKISFLQFVPASLLVVFLGILLNRIFINGNHTDMVIQNEHLVNLPVAQSGKEFLTFFNMPDWSVMSNSLVYILAVKLAIVASLETLLSVEAADKIDPFKRITPTNRELLAQGSGNVLSGLIGGLPITAVIVRSSANVNAGARSKTSAVLHGIWLLIAVAFMGTYMNLIPKASLAAILLMTGYKLSKPSLYKEAWKRGMDQFIPFAVTIAAILFTDLLIGIAIGLTVGIFFVARANYKSAIRLYDHDGNYLLRFNKDVTFVNKAELIQKLNSVPENCALIVNGSKAKFIDDDIIEVLQDFKLTAKAKNIELFLEDIPEYHKN